MPRTITVSSSYGAAGAVIGHAVAERLGLTFYDRAIPVAVARDLAVDPDEAFARDWRAPGRFQRVLRAISAVSLPFGGMESGIESGTSPDAEVFRSATETVLRSIADGEGGVIHGRGSMVVLRGRPDVLSVRVDGDLEGRIASMVRRSGVDEATARAEGRLVDEAREAYVQLFYGVSQHDLSLYHLVLDSTVLSVETCVEVILLAAEDRFAVS